MKQTAGLFLAHAAPLLEEERPKDETKGHQATEDFSHKNVDFSQICVILDTEALSFAKSQVPLGVRQLSSSWHSKDGAYSFRFVCDESSR